MRVQSTELTIARAIFPELDVLKTVVSLTNQITWNVLTSTLIGPNCFENKGKFTKNMTDSLS